MKFAISSSQISYFQEHREIQFDDVLSLKNLNDLKHSIDQLNPPFEKAYSLFLRSQKLLAFAKTRGLAQLAGALTMKKELQLLYDFYMDASFDLSLPYLQEEKLAKMGSFQKALIGLVIPLDREKGSIQCFRGDHPLSLGTLVEEIGPFYLIVYGTPKARYIYNPHDPFTHLLKSWGYSFGDALKHETHPMMRSAT